MTIRKLAIGAIDVEDGSGGGFGGKFIGETCRTQEAECGVSGVVPGGGQQVTKVPDPRQFDQACPAGPPLARPQLY
jgi:hypothetical protein